MLSTNRSLFGDWCVTREWGRIGSPGTVKVDHYADEATAIEQAARLMASKHKRGYVAEKPCAQCS